MGQRKQGTPSCNLISTLELVKAHHQQNLNCAQMQGYPLKHLEVLGLEEIQYISRTGQVRSLVKRIHLTHQDSRFSPRNTWHDKASLDRPKDGYIDASLDAGLEASLFQAWDAWLDSSRPTPAYSTPGTPPWMSGRLPQRQPQRLPRCLDDWLDACLFHA